MATAEIITQGDSIDLVVTTDKSVDSPASIKFVAQRQNSNIPAIQKSLGLGIVADSQFQFTVVLSREDTLTLVPGNYTIQAEYQDDSGKFKSIMFNPNYLVIRRRLSFV